MPQFVLLFCFLLSKFEFVHNNIKKPTNIWQSKLFTCWNRDKELSFSPWMDPGTKETRNLSDQTWTPKTLKKILSSARPTPYGTNQLREQRLHRSYMIGRINNLSSCAGLTETKKTQENHMNVYLSFLVKKIRWWVSIFFSTGSKVKTL